MNDRGAFEGIQSATILKPGDRVLIDCGKGARRSDIDTVLSELNECFPGVVFFALGGASVVQVQPAEGSTDAPTA